MTYEEFIHKKEQLEYSAGFEPVYYNDKLFDFQQYFMEWSVRKGRAAIFADCGMGKTAMQLCFAQNIVQKTNRRVIILTPLAVSQQTIREGERFGIEVHSCRDGKIHEGINVTNYEQLHNLNPEDFVGCVCDESSILKGFDGIYKSKIIAFMRKMPYRLLCTATAAPNDYIELGTSSEALGFLGHMDMLNRFFVNNRNNSATGYRMYGEKIQWRFKGHAELPFWQWVCSWARSIRKPSDFGFDDGKLILPSLIENQHIVKSKTLRDGYLFSVPAEGLFEQREERRRTMQERCEKADELASDGKTALIWCHLNDEGDLLEKLIPDSVQVSGRDSDESKEEKFMDFVNGKIRVLITKPKIGAWGLNFQHCSHIIAFVSNSYEQDYQGIRRCWRFGQKNPVIVDRVMSEGEISIMTNLARKSKQADDMFTRLIENMNHALKVDNTYRAAMPQEVPQWL